MKKLKHLQKLLVAALQERADEEREKLHQRFTREGLDNLNRNVLTEQAKNKAMETVKDNTKPPFKLAIIDLFDAYHYADFFEYDWRYAWLTGGYAPIQDYDKITAMADRLFWALNPDAKTQKEWYKWEAGYDVRVYDADLDCVYKAHEKLPEQ